MRKNEAVETKRRVLNGLNRLVAAPPDQSEKAALETFAPDAGWFGAHPLNRFRGVKEVVDGVWRPLKEAFPDLVRRDDIDLFAPVATLRDEREDRM